VLAVLYRHRSRCRLKGGSFLLQFLVTISVLAGTLRASGQAIRRLQTLRVYLANLKTALGTAVSPGAVPCRRMRKVLLWLLGTSTVLMIGTCGLVSWVMDDFERRHYPPDRKLSGSSSILRHRIEQDWRFRMPNEAEVIAAWEAHSDEMLWRVRAQFVLPTSQPSNQWLDRIAALNQMRRSSENRNVLIGKYDGPNVQYDPATRTYEYFAGS